MYFTYLSSHMMCIRSDILYFTFDLKPLQRRCSVEPNCISLIRVKQDSFRLLYLYTMEFRHSTFRCHNATS